jgi:diaminohydroxyphosphoribosylaminopyrimidine deaminase/5-amino-6-(5-phosphoribosylamino)uracil reductase
MSNSKNFFDATFMEMAIELSRKSRPSPNPQVGAVVVKNSRVVGAGYHEKPGAPHAEIVALKNAGQAARGADLYVTLEPCVHHGRTGPCVEAILEHGISRVAVGIADPDPKVNGKGIERLKQAGTDVEVGLLAAACQKVLESYTTHRLLGRPRVTLKAAITLDGYLATTTGDSKWISSPESRTVAHEMRAASDAVLVGVDTVISDDPGLTVRHVEGRSPLRIVLDSNLRTPDTAQIVTSAQDTPTMLVHAGADKNRAVSLGSNPGVEILKCRPTNQGNVDLTALVTELGQRGILALLVEGGAAVLSSFLGAGVADELVLFIAPRILGSGRPFVSFGGAKTIKEGLLLDAPTVTQVGSDILCRFPLTARDKNRRTR